MLGITSFQLEIPRTMRKKIANTPAYIDGLASIILNMYEDYIVPLWPAKEMPLAIPQPELAGKVLE
jgi:hypothetical protein